MKAIDVAEVSLARMEHLITESPKDYNANNEMQKNLF